MNWHDIAVAVIPFLAVFGLGEISKLNPFVGNLPTAVKAVILAAVAGLAQFFSGTLDQTAITTILMAIVQLIFPATAAMRSAKGIKV